jgi:hypothetical protein
MAAVPSFTPAHDAVLALLNWLPEDVEVDAALVAATADHPRGRGGAALRRAGGGRMRR